MGNWFKDLRFGFRRLLKNPLFTIVVVFSLALGIGANSAVFSLVNALFLRPLPVVKNPESLAWIFSAVENGPQSLPSSYSDYLDLRDRNETLSGLAAFSGITLSLRNSSSPELIPAQIVSGNYFDVLGVQASAGRTFLADEDATPGANPVVVISYGLWQRMFGADASLVGKTVSINGLSFNIIGIAPKGFSGMEIGNAPDAWVPMMMHKQVTSAGAGAGGPVDLLKERDNRWLNLVGRLKPGIGIEAAQANISTIASQVKQENPSTNKGITASVQPASGGLNPGDRGDLLPLAAFLMAVVFLLLLIVSTNVANLLLAQGSLRQRELGIRRALGASRAQLVRQLLSECLILALLGGAIGLIIALNAGDLLSAFLPLTLGSNLDAPVLLFTFGLSLLTTILFGLAPAIHNSKEGLVSSLKDEATLAGATYSKSWLRKIFIMGQVSLSLVLLIAAGLFIKSLQNARTVDVGFKTEKLVSLPIDLGLHNYPEPKGKAFYSQIVEQAKSLPGVQSATLTRLMPLDQSAYEQAGLTIEGRERQPDEEPIVAGVNVIENNYFDVTGIPILRGRGFGAQDVEGAPGVTIINETTARRLWPNEDPIGKRISVSGRKGPFMEIIGIAKDSKYRSITETPRLFLYQPLAQVYKSSMTLLARSSTDSSAIIPQLRNMLHSLDENLPVSDISTMPERLNSSLSTIRLGATLLGTFGILALLLAAIGLYGVIAYSVNQRTREIGIRMALGAQRQDVTKLILREGMMVVIIGIIVGVLAAFVLMKGLSSFFYGVSATDPVTFLAISVLLAGVALLACYFPARSASKIEPMVALRFH